MTRKRFIKICMSKGYSRNEANLIAKDITKVLSSYDEAIKELPLALWLSGR